MQKLIVPVYLNNRIVFDLMAMLKGGLSTVTSVTHTESTSSTSENEVSSKLGIGEVLSSLLTVNLSAAVANAENETDEEKKTEDRVHTPASLLFQLIDLMSNEGAIKKINLQSCIPGTFVEFECQLNKNPLIESLDTLAEISKILTDFQKPQAPKKGNRQQRQDFLDPEIMRILQAMLELLKSGDTIDLVGKATDETLSAVITLETGYLNDPLMSDLVDGHFKILGIITKSISDESDSINLLRKTTLSKLPSGITDSFIEVFKVMREDHEFNIPIPNISIEGPAIQVLPVAIFA